MKLPEWRPMPRHWQNDDDSKDAGAALFLIIGPVLILLGIGLAVWALLRLL